MSTAREVAVVDAIFGLISLIATFLGGVAWERRRESNKRPFKWVCPVCVPMVTMESNDMALLDRQAIRHTMKLHPDI